MSGMLSYLPFAKPGLVYSMGHLHSDLDARASAYAHAWLCNTVQGSNPKVQYIPVCHGRASAEALWAFRHFGISMNLFKRLRTARGKQVVLVDHNERSQALLGIGEAVILGILDHHTLGTGPALAYNPGLTAVTVSPVGSCATMIALLIRSAAIPISRSIAGVLLCAILDDTDNQTSRSTSELDIMMAQWLEAILQEDVKALYKRMFEAGQRALSRMTAEQMVEADVKLYMFGSRSVAVASVKFDDPGRLKNASDADLMREAWEYQAREGINCMLFLKVHLTPEGKRCSLVARGWEEEIFKVLGIQGNKGEFLSCPKEITSRKRLMNALRPIFER